MTILTRLGALGALSVLAACGSSSNVVDASGTPVDVSEVFAAAATFTPAEESGDNSTREAIESDNGWQGIIGLEDGSLVPLKINLDSEANTLTVTLGDGTPMVFTNTDSGGASRNWYSEALAQYVYLDLYGNSGSFSGGGFNWMRLDLVTAAADLPESGEVGYTGYFNMASGEDAGAYGNLALAVDFGSGAVSGGLVGSLYDYSEKECCDRELIVLDEEGPIREAPSGDSFFGTVEGSVEGSLLAATSELSGGTVGGSLGMLGAFNDGGSGVKGGIAGTIDGATMGGSFEAYSEERGGPF